MLDTSKKKKSKWRIKEKIHRKDKSAYNKVGTCQRRRLQHEREHDDLAVSSTWTRIGPVIVSSEWVTGTSPEED